MWKETTPEELNRNAFQMIGKDWLLVTAGTESSCNTMTASWGGAGVMWGKDVLYLVIRPQRYTKEFIDREERLSVCVLPETYRSVYGYLGRVSGRDEDKISKSGLTTAFNQGVPFFEEASVVFVCRKLFAQPYEADSFLDSSIIEKCYPDKDYHTLYICEIEKVLTKE